MTEVYQYHVRGCFRGPLKGLVHGNRHRAHMVAQTSQTPIQTVSIRPVPLDNQYACVRHGFSCLPGFSPLPFPCPFTTNSSALTNVQGRNCDSKVCKNWPQQRACKA